MPMMGRAKDAGSRLWSAPKTLFRVTSDTHILPASSFRNPQLLARIRHHTRFTQFAAKAGSRLKPGVGRKPLVQDQRLERLWELVVHGPWELLSDTSALRRWPWSESFPRLIAVLSDAYSSMEEYSPISAFSFYSAIFLATLKEIHSSICHFHRRSPSYSSVTDLPKIAIFSSFSGSPTFPPHQHCTVTAHERASIPIASLSDRGLFLLPRHSPTLPTPQQLRACV
jgi:hypothetical protein